MSITMSEYFSVSRSMQNAIQRNTILMAVFCIARLYQDVFSWKIILSVYIFYWSRNIFSVTCQIYPCKSNCFLMFFWTVVASLTNIRLIIQPRIIWAASPSHPQCQIAHQCLLTTDSFQQEVRFIARKSGTSIYSKSKPKLLPTGGWTFLLSSSFFI